MYVDPAGGFPVVSFGHGFLIPATDYDFFKFCAAAGDGIFLGMDGSPARTGVAFNPQVSLF